MRRIFKGTMIGMILYGLYVFVFGVLVFALPGPFTESELTFDTERMRTVSEEGVQAVLLGDNSEAFMIRIALIANAEHSIRMSSLYAHEGESRDVLFGALYEAAERGVQVELVFNSLRGYANFSARDFRVLNHHENITIRNFEPFHPFRPTTLQNGIHDKLLIVDEREAIIGGRNIDDRYFMGDQIFWNEVYDWEVFLQGENASSIKDMVNYFDEMFALDASKDIGTSSDPDRIDTLKTLNESFVENHDPHSTFETFSENMIPVDNVTFVHSPLTHGKKSPVILKTLSTLAENYDEWFIQTPAFGFTREMVDIIPKTENRSVTLLTNTPASSPNPWGTAGYLNYRGSLSEQATLHEHQTDTDLHGKAMRFGETITVIGSYNVNPRSTFYNSESLVVIYDPSFAALFDDALEPLLQDSLMVTPEGALVGDAEPTDMPLHRRVFLPVLRLFAYPLRFMQ